MQSVPNIPIHTLICPIFLVSSTNTLRTLETMTPIKIDDSPKLNMVMFQFPTNRNVLPFSIHLAYSETFFSSFSWWELQSQQKFCQQNVRHHLSFGEKWLYNHDETALITHQPSPTIINHHCFGPWKNCPFNPWSLWAGELPRYQVIQRDFPAHGSWYWDASRPSSCACRLQKTFLQKNNWKESIGFRGPMTSPSRNHVLGWAQGVFGGLLVSRAKLVKLLNHPLASAVAAILAACRHSQSADPADFWFLSPSTTLWRSISNLHQSSHIIPPMLSPQWFWLPINQHQLVGYSHSLPTCYN